MSPEALARLREAVRVFDLDSIEHDPIVSFDDLRALLHAYDTARAEGVAAERARIVADLRTHKWHPGGTKGAISPERAADRYERGEHDKEEAAIPAVFIFGFPPVNP